MQQGPQRWWNPIDSPPNGFEDGPVAQFRTLFFCWGHGRGGDESTFFDRLVPRCVANRCGWKSVVESPGIKWRGLEAWQSGNVWKGRGQTWRVVAVSFLVLLPSQREKG